MVVYKFFLKIGCLGLLVFAAGLVTVYAQEPIGTVVEPITITAPSGPLSLSLQQLGYETVRLSPGDPEVTYRVNLPGNFSVSPGKSYLNLVLSQFPAVPDKPAGLRVELNNKILTTISFPLANPISQTLRVDVPDNLLQVKAPNNLIFSLVSGGTCADPNNVVEAVIDQASSLNFDYQQNHYEADLAHYPYPFAETSLLKIPVTVVLPDRPTPGELSAAATIAAGLGQASLGKVQLTAVKVSELSPETQNNQHLILIGKPGGNRLIDNLQLPLPLTSTVIKADQGVLQEVVSPWNEFRLVLVVSGQDDAALIMAGNALNRQAKFLGMRGPTAVVVDLLPLTKPVKFNPSSQTLASLNYEDEIIYGTMPQKYTVDFYLPLDWHMDQPPFMVLKFNHADIIDPQSSSIDAKLNRVPVGSTLLDKSNAAEGELTLSLPAHLLKAGRNRLEIGVAMNLPHTDVCTGQGDQRAWTVIRSDSEIVLPYSQADLTPDLALFPYPFSSSSGFYETVFVLPDQATSQNLGQLIQLAARLGSSSVTEYISVPVVYASNITEDTRKSFHLIVLGRHSQNKLLAEVNPRLPQPFVENGDLLKPLAVDKVAFLPDPKRDAGLLEIIPSPWSKNRTLIALTGTTDHGVDLAVQALLNLPANLAGNLAVVEPVFDPASGEASRISTYSIDTRPPEPEKLGATRNNSPSGDAVATLAQRWWK